MIDKHGALVKKSLAKPCVKWVLSQIIESVLGIASSCNQIMGAEAGQVLRDPGDCNPEHLRQITNVKFCHEPQQKKKLQPGGVPGEFH
ncbi:MAG TPA: hypothetical protein VKY89_09905 [Thermoanaerobaculia bacterium]|nr:hypothetical protein [Thermoanaerobaculia bacterium]